MWLDRVPVIMGSETESLTAGRWLPDFWSGCCSASGGILFVLQRVLPLYSFMTAPVGLLILCLLLFLSWWVS